MEESSNDRQRPNLKDRLFWDWKVEEINWQKSARSVIERVLSRGDNEEYGELVRFYGLERVIHVLTVERCNIPNISMDIVTAYFGLKKEELSCYQWRLEHGYNWI